MRNTLRFPIVLAMLVTVCVLAVPTYADTQSVVGCTGCNNFTFFATLTQGSNGNYTLDYTITNTNVNKSGYAFNWSLTLFDSQSVITSAMLQQGSHDDLYGALAGKSNNGNASCNATLSNAVCVEPLDPAALYLLNPGDAITFHLDLVCDGCTELTNWIFLASGNNVNNRGNAYAISTTGTAVPEAPEPMLLGISGVIGLCSLVGRKWLVQ